MEFKKYQHVERFGTDATEGILNGTVFIFPKIDGANASVWLDDFGDIAIGSRNRQLKPDDNFRGLRQYVENHKGIRDYLEQYPARRLFGEWLIPHTIKNYRPDAWKHFYVFDVMENGKYLNYFDYAAELIDFGIKFIDPIISCENPTAEQIQAQLDKCTFLMQDNLPGEGIVIKNYDFVNKFGNVIWAKIVRPAPITPKIQRKFDADNIESAIVDKFITTEFVAKEFAKIAVDGWNSKLIGKFLGTVWHTFITEEIFNILRKFHNPKIDFGLLHALTIERIKFLLPNVF